MKAKLNPVAPARTKHAEVGVVGQKLVDGREERARDGPVHRRHVGEQRSLGTRGLEEQARPLRTSCLEVDHGPDVAP